MGDKIQEPLKPILANKKSTANTADTQGAILNNTGQATAQISDSEAEKRKRQSAIFQTDGGSSGVQIMQVANRNTLYGN